jgi:hypothetical protein
MEGDTSTASMTFNSHQSKYNQLKIQFNRRYQQLQDHIVPWKFSRWGAFGFLLFLYFIRVFIFVGGYYVVTYTMSIHLLYCLVVLITPLSDPDQEDNNNDDEGGSALPTSGFAVRGQQQQQQDEHKPFIPKVAEFKIWRSMFKVVVLGFLATFFSIFDLPVFWPILLLYFVLLFVTQMAGRIRHMMRHKYVPWNANKPKFVAKDEK